MTHRLPLFVLTSTILIGTASVQLKTAEGQAASQVDATQDYLTSTRCIICHSNLKTAKGEDVSIGTEWQASIMANSARDPYWQGSVHRETIDHAESSGAIQNDCARCHMPLQHLIDKSENRETTVLSRTPLAPATDENAAAADGVSCSVCHQIEAAGLGQPVSFNGKFAVAAPGTKPRPVFGPFSVTDPRALQIHSLATGYAPTQTDQVREAGLCGSCHTLYTVALGPGGKPAGRLPEQMTYLEWLHSDYRNKQTCQQCHMPPVEGAVAIASLYGQPRVGVRRHAFLGANFLVDAMLNTHHDELAVAAQPAELAAAVSRTEGFLRTHSAHITVEHPQLKGEVLSFEVLVNNLTGHKLPTAFPARRAWLHVVVTSSHGRVIFESGKLNLDGSISGNANDADRTRYSPHFALITKPDQVEIFEAILGDSEGHVTTGLLTATQYLKDNRILPDGFAKQSAPDDIAVHGKAASDPDFTGGSSTTHYAITTRGASGPLHITVELMYQPVGYRWAHNLASYKAPEPQRFVHYYEEAAAHSALILAQAETAVDAGH